VGSTIPLRPLRALALVPLALLAGACGSSQLDTMEQQIGDIQRQVLVIQRQGAGKEEVAGLQQQSNEQSRNLLKAQADIQNQLQGLATQLEQLEARLEDTNERLNALSQQIAATNQQLKGMRPDAAVGNAVPGVPPPAAAPSAGSDPETQYRAAYNDYLRGSYDLALAGFRQYLEAFPNTDLTDNAAYWIGECYYRQKKYQDAIRQFDLVTSQYPNSDKMASALLRKGYAYIELGEQSKGVVQLQNVIRRFPRSDEANLAKQQLSNLGIDPGQSGG
jgi:tol-pal system protein YbgF